MKKTVVTLLAISFFIALTALPTSFGLGHAWIGDRPNPSGGSAAVQGTTLTPFPQNSDLQLTRLLVDEVKLLRLAVERSQVGSVVLQAALERMRYQQEQVNFIAQRLENVRSEIASSQGSQPRFTQILAELEGRIKSEEDEKTKTSLQRDYRDTQIALEQQKLLEEQQRVQADNLASQLALEQGKLSQLNEQLDRLEQEAKAQTKSTTTKTNN